MTQNRKTSETVSSRSGSQVSTSSMSNKSMVLVLEGILSLRGQVKTKRFAWMCTSPVFPAAMPIRISSGMVPCSVSKRAVAMISKAGP